MPRIPSRKTRIRRLMEDCYSVDMSGASTLKLLQENGLGLRKKKFYEEWRTITKKDIKEGKREKSIPKKYRKEDKGLKKWERKSLGIGQIYRGSLIISSVPLHSTPFNRHYLGFRLNVFSFDKKSVSSALNSMKNDFLKKVGDYLRSFAYAQGQTLGIESATRITVTNTKNLNNKWFFAVEEKGKDIDSESGYI